MQPASKRETEEARMPEYDDRGVDVSLIRWMLSLTPAQRLQVLQSAADSLQELRELSKRA